MKLFYRKHTGNILTFCLLIFLIHSCNTKIEKSKTKLSNIQCEKADILIRHDFEKIKTHIFLVCENDTIDKLVINECYANGGELKALNDSLFLYKYQVRGGIGVDRKRTLLLYQNNDKLSILFNIISKDNFRDEFLKNSTQQHVCNIKIISDSIILEWTENQDNILKFKKENRYLIHDLISKKENVIEFW